MKTYDVAIIGAGTAGLSARREVFKKTSNYIVIDGGPLGTTCARVGCMPSKVLIQVAEDYHRRFELEAQGILGSEKLEIDHSKVMSYVRQLRDRFTRSVIKSMEDWKKDHFLQGYAKFIDENTLDIDGKIIQAKKIIIATGSSPIIPKPWLEYQDFFINTDEFFELENLPQKVGIIGLGVIGIELGQALSRLGIEVKGFDIQRAVGGMTDPQLIDYAINTFTQEIDFHFGKVDIVGTKNNKIILKSQDKEYEFDKIFLTMGRRPQLDQLQLENAGVKLNERGIPDFISNQFQIRNKPIYIVGDVNGERPILHEAADEGRIAGFNALQEKNQCFQRRTSLGIVFTDPQIGLIGKSHRQLSEEKIDFITGKVSYEGQGRAIVKRKEKGLAHIYIEKNTGDFLGAELFAPQAEHLSHLLAWALSLKLNVHEILSLPYYHPVLEEGIRTAFREAADQITTKTPTLEVMRCEDPPAGTRISA